MAHEIETLALTIATYAHAGATRMDGVTPYITHPVAVAESFPEAAIVERAVALLHDVLEDTIVTVGALHGLRVPPLVVAAVIELTRREDETYRAYIDRIIARRGRVGRLARAVKLADARHNLATLPAGHGLAKRFEATIARLEA